MLAVVGVIVKLLLDDIGEMDTCRYCSASLAPRVTICPTVTGPWKKVAVGSSENLAHQPCADRFPKAAATLKRLLATGTTQAECAAILGVSVRTIGRAVARVETLAKKESRAGG